jgi:sarcosine oxidase subunit beta
MADVIIIGAGISEAVTAYELATAGLDVVPLDRYAPAAMASDWTLAGVRQSGRDPAEMPLARAAVEMWGTLAERLDASTRCRRHGNLAALVQGKDIDLPLEPFCIERFNGRNGVTEPIALQG